MIFAHDGDRVGTEGLETSSDDSTHVHHIGLAVHSWLESWDVRALYALAWNC